MIYTQKKFAGLLLLWVPLIVGNYKSQIGQDQYLNETIFKNKRAGVFIDIGAHDGERFSNTWFYEKMLGWTGICFEPMPDIFRELVQNRSCICINAAVSDKEGFTKFRQVDVPSEELSGWPVNMLSGIESKFEERARERIETDLKKFGGTYKFIDVNCCLFNKILEKYNIHYIDFLSLDTEGGELDILKSIDFDKFYIHTMSVENNYHSPDIPAFLASKGFCMIKEIFWDELYVNINTPKLNHLSSNDPFWWLNVQ